MDKQAAAITTKWLYLFIAIAVLVNLSGLFVPIIGPDGTLYASIAKTMAQRNNFVDLFAYGKDWLDKPHFPFWIAALLNFLASPPGPISCRQCCFCLWGCFILTSLAGPFTISKLGYGPH
jgi:4-amino-4-deoxy-L-arabinose transferase-like glycosyltransferase